MRPRPEKVASHQPTNGTHKKNAPGRGAFGNRTGGTHRQLWQVRAMTSSWCFFERVMKRTA